MKVLVITNMYPSKCNPLSGTFVHDQVEALKSAGIDIDVLHIDGGESKLNYFRGIAQFWRHIRSTNYDLIHAHYVHSGWIARMQIGLPIVVTSHGSDTLGHEGWFLKRLHPLVDAITITSKQNQDRIGLHDTILLPCGINIDQFKPQNQAQARRLLGWDLDRQTMLYVGRDSPLKRLDILRDAHAIVSRSRDSVDLVLATSIAHDDIPLYMNAADVFVFASETEGAPVVIKEAMACNLPIVSVDVGDIREVIESATGCFVCDRNPESLASGVLRVLDSGKRSQGRDIITQLYTRDVITHRIIQLYKHIIDKAD